MKRYLAKGISNGYFDAYEVKVNKVSEEGITNLSIPEMFLIFQFPITVCFIFINMYLKIDQKVLNAK